MQLRTPGAPARQLSSLPVDVSSDKWGPKRGPVRPMAIAKSDKRPYLRPPGPAGFEATAVWGRPAAAGGPGSKRGNNGVGGLHLEHFPQTRLIGKKLIFPLRPVVQSIKMKEN